MNSYVPFNPSCVHCIRQFVSFTVSNSTGGGNKWLTNGAAAGIDVLADFIPGKAPVQAVGKFVFKTVSNATVTNALGVATATSFDMAMQITVCSDGKDSVGSFGMPSLVQESFPQSLYRDTDWDQSGKLKPDAQPYATRYFQRNLTNWYHTNVPPGTATGEATSVFESWT